MVCSSLKSAFASNRSRRVARALVLAAFAMVVSVARPRPASGGNRAITPLDALPRQSERLDKPIWMPHCGTWLVEWRSTPSLSAETTAGAQANAVIDATCKDAFDRYGDFLRHKGLPRLRSNPDVMPTISLLPANILLDGKEARSLNDLSRFEAVAPGCCYWGLYVDGIRHLFLRNDPLLKDANGSLQTNPRFVRTFTHELSHILSARLGVWDAVGYDRQRDEDLAEEFVAFMGMRFPADTSDEDLAYHGDHRDTRIASTASATPPAGSTGAQAAKVLPHRGVSASASPQR